MKQTTSRANAFTLVEMLVAIAVLSILLAVVFVPLRLAINSFHIGQAQSSTQNAAQATLDDMERDFRRAGYIFPNTALVNVTDKAPYTNNLIHLNDPQGVPYTKSIDGGDTATPTRGICEKVLLPAVPSPTPVPTSAPNSYGFGNTSRLDMILVKRDGNGKAILPPQPDDSVVTYYPRRQNINLPYDPVDNPLVLYRAEFPFRDISGTVKAPELTTADNATIPAAYPSGCTAIERPNKHRGALWLEHNVYGEANLDLLVEAGNGVQTAAIPRGVGLVASQAYRLNSNLNPAPTPPTTAEAPLVPDTSFQLSDTNGDGKINQVAVSLALETFDSGQGANVNSNGQPKGQIVRARRVFDLPNVR